jgi:hypothetical protein
LLTGGQPLEVTVGEKQAAIAVPAEMPDRIATVIALDVEGTAGFGK